MSATTTPLDPSAPRRPSFLAKSLGWLGLVLMIVPVGFPMYAAIGLIGVTLAWAVFTGTWVILFILAILCLRRRPLVSFVIPFIASGAFFGLFYVVELIDPPA